MAERKIFPRFNFVGETVISSKRRNWVRRETVGTASKITMDVGIKDGGNCVFVTASDFKNDVIKTKDINENDISINWSDRFDEEVVKNVSGKRKFVVALDERKEFITAWDMIEYLEDVLPQHQGDVCMTGKFVILPGFGSAKDRVFESFEVQNVYAANPDDARRFLLNMELYYGKDSMDKSSLKENGKIYISAYTPMWSRADGATKMFPISSSVVLNTSLYDLSDEKDKNRCNYLLRYIDTKSIKAPVKMRWHLEVLNGAEEKKFDENCLTEAQKEQIELGFATMEDYRPRGSIYGEKIREFRLTRPDVRGEYASATRPLDSGYTTREFEDEIYTPSVDESLADLDIKASASAATTSKKSGRIEDVMDIDNIFD